MTTKVWWFMPKTATSTNTKRGQYIGIGFSIRKLWEFQAFSRYQFAKTPHHKLIEKSRLANCEASILRIVSQLIVGNSHDVMSLWGAVRCLYAHYTIWAATVMKVAWSVSHIVCFELYRQSVEQNFPQNAGEIFSVFWFSRNLSFEPFLNNHS